MNPIPRRQALQQLARLTAWSGLGRLGSAGLLGSAGALGSLGSLGAVGSLGALGGCVALPEPPGPPGAAGSVPGQPASGLGGLPLPPPPPRELRGAWVATVANIDWPSRPGLPGAQQRAEALLLLDRAAALGLNALMLQVRPAADAIYPSPLEPWTEYLSGTQGQAPDDAYDPLAFWVEQAHRRGLQLHAWFNPYRARHPSAKSPLAPGHVALRQPDIVRRYGDMLWLDPAEPAAAAHTLAVVADVLQRYDIDGVHIDDYFYPYPISQPASPAAAPPGVPANGQPNAPSTTQPNGQPNSAAMVELPFPDDAPWARYLASGGGLSRPDWRRQQVDKLVQAMQRTVRRLRPTAQFGISPFGLPQPAQRPPGITGFSQYDKLYADVERWLAEGWMDYCAPQLYWPIDRTAQAFEVLLDTWLRLNPRGLAMWPGLYTSMVGAANRPWPAAELLAQVQRLRLRPAAGGHIHFSLIALAQDRDGLATQLRAGPYAQAALAPVFAPPGAAEALLPGELPGAPQVLPATGPPDQQPRWRLVPGPGAAVAQWAVWRHQAGQWRFATQPALQDSLLAEGADALVLSAVTRRGLEGPRHLLMSPQETTR